MKKRFVKDVRSPHGTRVSKTIVCSRCGKSDTIAFVPKDNRPILCKACAEEQLGIIGEGDARNLDQVDQCELCQKRFPSAARNARPRVLSAREQELEALLKSDGRTLCTDCRAKVAAERRATAKKPRGLHPIVVKRAKGKND